MKLKKILTAIVMAAGITLHACWKLTTRGGAIVSTPRAAQAPLAGLSVAPPASMASSSSRPPVPPPAPAARSLAAMPSDVRTDPFPVVLLAHARPRRLNITLASLLHVRQVEADQVFVLQDGSDEEVSAVVRAAGMRLVPLPAAHGRRHAPRGRSVDKTGGTIARAYHAALSLAFDQLTDDDAVVVVEDDLLFSPDLMDFFLAGYHVMRADTTIWCVSAWNDNGFRGLVGADPHQLLRTGWFPGLGWLLTRKLYKRELEPAWPKEHWDHWMRSERVYRTSKGRECLYPSIPRTFHHGATGTFMNAALHDNFFAHIAHSVDATVQWPPSGWPELRAHLRSKAYEVRLRRTLALAQPLTDLRKLLQGGNVTRPPLALWYTQPPRGSSLNLFRDLALLIGIWHEMRRASHQGVHELWCGGVPLLLVNTVQGPGAQPSPYMDLAPEPAKVFTTEAALRKAVLRAVRAWPGRSQTSICRDLSKPSRACRGRHC